MCNRHPLPNHHAQLHPPMAFSMAGLPKFVSGGEPAIFLTQAESWVELQPGAFDVKAPGKLAKLLVQACTSDQKAAEFSVSLVQENPQISYQQTRDAFTSRFEKEVRSRGTVARDKLFSCKICMNISSVQEYINDFRQQILHIPDMHEEDKIC